MSDEDFDEEPELDDDDIDEDDLDEEDLGDDVLDDDDDVEDVDTLDLDIDTDLEPEIPVATVVAPDEAKEEDEEDDVLDLDEELHPDDVEAPLDALLQERTASATLEDDEDELDEEEADADDRGEGPTRIVPRRPGEFLCSSCFLVLPRNQLADEERMLCRDCA
ncbi:MAG TPA: DUF4193 family protein [Acidimicrobiia bacterium]|nr:DUF4193 family protein [Acidimicrobiia bacterium]